MALPTRSYGKVQVLELKGRFDAYLAPAVHEALAQAATPFIVINLGAVEFVDSSALAVLVSGMKRCRQQGGILRLCSVTQPVRMVFELTRMDRAFEIFASEAEAVSAFEN